MTSFTPSAAPTAAYGGRPNILRRAEAWLDSKGRKAWIAAMVLGFVFFWPVGLFFVAYITATNRWSSDKMFGCAARKHRHVGDVRADLDERHTKLAFFGRHLGLGFAPACRIVDPGVHGTADEHLGQHAEKSVQIHPPLLLAACEIWGSPWQKPDPRAGGGSILEKLALAGRGFVVLVASLCSIRAARCAHDVE